MRIGSRANTLLAGLIPLFRVGDHTPCGSNHGRHLRSKARTNRGGRNKSGVSCRLE